MGRREREWEKGGERVGRGREIGRREERGWEGGEREGGGKGKRVIHVHAEVKRKGRGWEGKRVRWREGGRGMEGERG